MKSAAASALLLVILLYIVTVRRVSALNMRSSVSKSLVICGPSGVGKGTIIKSIMAQFPSKIALSVSHTTRKPRPGEVDGVHYHFTSSEVIHRDIKAGKFLEYAEVHNNIYGTSYKSVEEAQSNNRLCLLDVDTKGVRQLKMANLPMKYVFVAPPSVSVLEERLRGRGTETEEQMRTRLNNSLEELKFGTPSNFDKILVNSDLEEAVSDLAKYIALEYESLGPWTRQTIHS
jgi:guanylate kinase